MANDTLFDGLLDVLIARIADAVADRLEVRWQQVAAPQVPDGLLDEPAMAERLCISQQSLQRRRKVGDVPFVACGRRVLYQPDDVIAALKSQEQNGGAV